ncbi:hypothetical protein Tco_0642911 [Tanacetum coccineum]
MSERNKEDEKGSSYRCPHPIRNLSGRKQTSDFNRVMRENATFLFLTNFPESWDSGALHKLSKGLHKCYDRFQSLLSQLEIHGAGVSTELSLLDIMVQAFICDGEQVQSLREQLGNAIIEIQAYTQALKKIEAKLVTYQQNQLWYEEKIRFMKVNLDDKTDVLAYHKKLLAEALKEKEELKTKFENWQNSSKNLGKLLNTQMSANDKFRLGYGDHIYGDDKSKEDTSLKSKEKPVDEAEQAFLKELERLKKQEKEANDAAEALRKEVAQGTEDLLHQRGDARASGTKTVSTASTPVSTASPSRVLGTDKSFSPVSFNYADQDDSQILAHEDIYDNPSHGIFSNASYDDEGVVTDFTNLETFVDVSPLAKSRIHSIHPTS